MNPKDEPYIFKIKQVMAFFVCQSKRKSHYLSILLDFLDYAPFFQTPNMIGLVQVVRQFKKRTVTSSITTSILEMTKSTLQRKAKLISRW